MSRILLHILRCLFATQAEHKNITKLYCFIIIKFTTMLRYKSSSVTSSNTLETVQDSQIVAMGNKNVVFEQCGL